MSKRACYRGVKINILTGVAETADKVSQGYKWEWLCDCCKTVFTTVAKVKSGHTKSCGCIRSSTKLNGKRVYGEGISEDGKYARYTTVKGKRKMTKEYHLWVGVLERCYSKSVSIDNPSYVGCTMSENFKDFQWFAEWCQVQVGFNVPSYHLDKDILLKGNKEYSENTCVFVPSEVNSLLIKSKGNRGRFPIGVVWNKKGSVFEASCNTSVGVRKYLGAFDNPEDAFTCYKTNKECFIKETALRITGTVDQRVISALNNYVVEDTD